ncbi:NAD(P)-binding domain-containing protein [Actinomadura opuntiae]|uniref:NAD(P)-binding domain-containing protein n=1 Tax=Actinomadura sp. OS1-43 TaxID=604315 RepID=UPI00255B1957|nr:NAD(P)-binding domain-containing protein [Actinomadura sp. OS1-43]MDL4818794.1 NAD(P)-binding domain-containing protein [Actinomadura sp. OS1-43]
MTRIAFLGLGRMGVLMAGRLIAAGHDVAVWNRTAAKAAPAVEAGATLAASPAQAAAGRDLVITMLTDGNAVEDVLFGPGGAADALAPGAVIADTSTIGPDAARRVRDRLPDGVGYLDAPVVGSVPQAEAGELEVLAGGTADDIARAGGALEALGRVRHVGPPGSGAALKLVANGVLVANFAVLGEALALAGRLGVDRGLALDVLARTSAQARRLRDAAPGAPPRFTLALAAKDLGLALDAPGAPASGVLSAARARASAALADGLGPHDLIALADHARKDSPMRVALGNPATVPPPPNPFYSHAAHVTAGPMLYVSGQVAFGEDGKIDAPGDMGRQSEVIFGLLERILAAHGAGFADVVNVRTFVTDLDRVAEYGAVRRRYFSGAAPTSTTVEVSRLFHPDALLEVEVVAAVP